MSNNPKRLKAKRLPLVQKPEQPIDDDSWAGITLPTQRNIIRRLRAIRRGVLTLLWTVPCVLIQSVLVLFASKPREAFAQIYWRVTCSLIGLDVRVIGAAAHTTAEGRPVVFVSNHSSWLDILVLGGRLPAAFIAKEEVSRWPVVRTLARLGRTVYVRRKRSSTAAERDDMQNRLKSGDSLILFPEGTTSDGSRVLPFRTAFLSIAELPASSTGLPPIVQPVSVVYDRLSGLPTGRASRPLFAWYGDMDIGSHFWRLAQHKGLRATVLLHQPLDPLQFASRKELASVCWKIVADGASTLRQNRPATPISFGERAEAAHEPAFV
jgi:1-acyl-sn-glycerol-3-phosphate acyltransferase